MPHVPASRPSAELLPWKSHCPWAVFTEVLFLPRPQAVTEQQVGACLKPQEGRVLQSEAIVQGQQGGGHCRHAGI